MQAEIRTSGTWSENKERRYMNKPITGADKGHSMDNAEGRQLGAGRFV